MGLKRVKETLHFSQTKWHSAVYHAMLGDVILSVQLKFPIQSSSVSSEEVE